jgi:glycosyltransferase involved in cell wall biosynthesis
LNYLSVIIPVGYDPDGLLITLNSLLDQVDSVTLDIIVINDGADENVTRICNSFDVREFSFEKNIGPAAGRNYGVSVAHYDNIAFLDADVRASKNWAIKIVNSLQINHFVAGAIEIDPDLIDGFFHQYDSLTAFDVETYMKAGHAATANLALRKEVFEKAGGFDPDLRSGEDTEFGDRITSLDVFNCSYNEEAKIFHPPRGGKAQLIKRARVVKGHLNLCIKYPNRYDKYKKVYLNPFYMLRPPMLLFKKLLSSNDVSLYKRIGFCLYGYFLKIYSFSCCVNYWIRRGEVKLETKRHS